jgi:hypothetical protein
MLSAVAAVFALMAQSDPVGEATRQAQRVEDRFYAALQDCGVKAPPKPPLRAELKRGVVQYDSSGTVLVFPWEGMDPGTHEALTALAQRSGSGLSGRATYASIFNELLVAHELGHWLQAGRLKDNRWASEQDANRIMVAFWREHPDGRATAVRFAEYLSFVPGDHNPMPPPAGQSVRQYFNANYAALTRSPAYGWYQNMSGRSAYAERPRSRFCTLIRRWKGVA